MIGLNRVMLIGNVGGDPEVFEYGNGGRGAEFRFATTERFKEEGKTVSRTEWHTVFVTMPHLVNLCEKHIRKGTVMYLEGKVHYRLHEDEAGKKSYITEIIGQRFQLLPVVTNEEE